MSAVHIQVSATLFTEEGEATAVLQGALADVPSGRLVDDQGLASPLFRNYLSGIVSAPLPIHSEPLADRDGRATRAMTLLLMGVR